VTTVKRNCRYAIPHVFSSLNVRVTHPTAVNTITRNVCQYWTVHVIFFSVHCDLLRKTMNTNVIWRFCTWSCAGVHIILWL